VRSSEGDRRIPLAHVIADRAARHGEQILVQEVGGESLTYAELQDRSLRWASVLEGLGVGPGEAVLSTATGTAAYWTWLGAAWRGAVHVPLNPDLRGRLLSAAISTTGARVAVVEARHLAPLLAVAAAVPGLAHVLVIGEFDDAGGLGPRLHHALDLFEAAVPKERPGPEESDVAAAIFTSGTTGPSKCALRTWAAVELSGRWLFPGDPDGTTPGGAYYGPWPPYHSLGLTGLTVAVQRDLRLVLREGFSLSGWWDDIRTYGCTHAVLLVVAPLVVGREPRPDDADNPLQHLTVVPLVRDIPVLEARFGVRVGTMYGQTETGAVLVSARPRNHRSVGRPAPEVEAAVADPDGRPVGPGEVGELVVRTLHPGQISDAYLGMPEVMAGKWRDGWFRTGDAFRIDADGNYEFVDRLNDCIRSRGHNLSSIELEREILEYPDVAECACVGVPSDLAEDDVFGDQDVKAVVVSRPGVVPSAEALLAFLEPRLPKFMLPRYIEFVAELPKTPTQRVRKEQLRQAVPGNQVWDRQAVG
jgi:crotonobetaine/carnitine-CoA ligase